VSFERETPHPQPVPACLQSRGASQLAAPAVRAPDALAQVEIDRTPITWHLTYFALVGVFGGFGQTLGSNPGAVSTRGSSWRRDVTEHRVLLCVSQARRTWQVGLWSPLSVLHEFLFWVEGTGPQVLILKLFPCRCVRSLNVRKKTRMRGEGAFVRPGRLLNLWLRVLLFRALDLSGDDHRLLLLTSCLYHLLTEALEAFLDLKLQTNYDLDDRMLLLGFLKSSRDLTTDMSMNCCTDLQMPRVFSTKTKEKGVTVVIQTSLASDT
jgi:hypothetical protein